jgi:hypothetical protein
MKKVLVLISLFLIAGAAFAQNAPDIAPGNNVHSMGVRGWAGPGGGGQPLLYHSPAPVLRNARVVLIFWGPSFGNGGAQAAYAGELQAFRNQFGTSGEYNTITEYYDTTGNIAQSNLKGTNADWFDTSTPPVSVSDAAVQSEVLAYLNGHGSFDNSTVYEVFIPPGSYSNDGGTSCGGPNLQYCAYHGHFSNGGRDIKYSIEPYPNCTGCSVSGWTAAQNQEHFVCHETREAVTDPDLNAWFDRRGSEADDKCAWTPSPFLGSGGYGYQYEWSNAVGGCVKTK